MLEKEPLIPKHGGYRKLKSFQVAQLVYDVTIRFCDRYVEKRSRTHDQMVQAARSGVQNIAEGSQAAGTSKKTELKLTNVARASLGRSGPNNINIGASGSQSPSPSSTQSRKSTFPEIAANAALVLIAVACSLLDRQLASLAAAFEREGGFTERLYRVRARARGQ